MDNEKWSLGIISLPFLLIASSSAEFFIQQVTEGRGTEYNSSYNPQANLEVTRVLREEPPSSKIVTITSFSVIKNREESYESSLFETAGYKWRLVLYVKGNSKDGGNGYISLYVRIEETKSLPRGWEVNVDLTLFVYNPMQNKYLTVTDGAVKRFNSKKKEWGFGQLIALPTFYNTSEGYVMEDSGSFGAEIFIVKPAEQQEEVTVISNPPNSVFTWNVSTLKDGSFLSNEFLVEGRYWKLGLYLSGINIDTSINPLLVDFYSEGYKKDALVTGTWGAVKLRLKNQLSSNDREIYFALWYPIQSVRLNLRLINLDELKNPTNGYLVNDTIIIEAELVQVSVTNIVSA